MPKNMNTEAGEAVETAAAPLDAWTMATSILAGLHKAEAQARAEYEQKAEAAGQNPFAAGVPSAAHLIEALRDARKDLTHGLSSIARANDFPMPRFD